MSPLRRHIFVCFMAKSVFFGFFVYIIYWHRPSWSRSFLDADKDEGRIERRRNADDLSLCGGPPAAYLLGPSCNTGHCEGAATASRLHYVMLQVRQWGPPTTLLSPLKCVWHSIKDEWLNSKRRDATQRWNCAYIKCSKSRQDLITHLPDISDQISSSFIAWLIVFSRVSIDVY